MSSPRINYLDYDTFSRILFSIIEEQLDYDPSDPLPDYRKEHAAGLEKILVLVKNDIYYPEILDKASYLFVSIVEGHIYSNGNKRLGLVTMLYFLTMNHISMTARSEELVDLCLFVADKKRNSNLSFDDLKIYVRNFLNRTTNETKLPDELRRLI